MPTSTLLKGEGSALQIADTIEAVDGALAVFNGRGGLELTDNFRAGCVGMIPAPECADIQVQIYEHMRAGREEEAERLYEKILPLVTFLMQSVDQFLCYGKRLTARRPWFRRGVRSGALPAPDRTWNRHSRTSWPQSRNARIDRCGRSIGPAKLSAACQRLEEVAEARQLAEAGRRWQIAKTREIADVGCARQLARAREIADTGNARQFTKVG